MSVVASIITGSAARVTLTLSGWAGHTMTISRVDPAGRQLPIIAGRSIPAVGGTWDDPEIPLGVPIYYRVASADGVKVETSNTVTVVADRPILSDPWRGLTASVILASEGDREHDSRTTRIDVAGRADRHRIWDVEAAARVQPQLITTTAADLAAVDAIMASGDPFLLRCPCAGVLSGWLQRVGGRTVARITGSGPGRLHSLADVDVLSGAPSDLRPVGDTLGDLDQYVTDYESPFLGAIADTWATLGAIAAADIRGML